ncbi:methyltransferase family protein [Marinobacter nauticus]|uniref:methyltransferase family protein n=1 Tax=Marinobacter nauticus TaxID=2743 RepID=UPI001C98F32D|nr:isoprenylcysteine carboxylmethyltransferase family protein [Marinobacter nauticus]MBY5935948.1 isoprenylcysteine carboxylmethyltransferase family protein [Marinobacter nauticus]MBY5953177.1 isoprenylcysteine carboxylmethyltransferase family protein [Marinobacter nauticus]MBY6006970.1 isoprenylcysteine carboxylmethyltransferase family protein [Marinobacter nauticus]
MKALELKVPPVVLVILFGAAMWVISRLLPSGYFAVPGRLILCTAVLLAGAGIALAGVLAFRSAGTTVDPRTPHQSASLVVDGVYRYTRNPMYLGFLLMLIAWSLYLGSVFAALLLPLFMLYMNRFQIKPEERHMRALFGDDYAHYTSRVGRWF